jgi:hypothetical protein
LHGIHFMTEETTPAPPIAPPHPAPAASPAHSESKRATLALVAAVAAWLIPGLGHALLKMWGRALAIFFSVGLLVILGSGMRGNIFPPNGDDAFSKLGYVADMGAGSFYFLARALEVDGPDVSRATGDYGTRLLATAGVLNLLAALHAYEIIRGRKA